MNVPNSPLTPPVNAQQQTNETVQEALKAINLHTASDRTKGTMPYTWCVEAHEEGLLARHDSGEVFVGSHAEFNAHLKG